MAFLIAFACSVASVQSPGMIQCADRTQVRLAQSSYGMHLDADAADDTLLGQKLRCQGFASDRPGQLVATCRLPSGAEIARDNLRRGPLHRDKRDES